MENASIQTTKARKKRFKFKEMEQNQCFFYFVLQEKGEYELKVEASAENKVTPITEKFKTFEKTAK